MSDDTPKPTLVNDSKPKETKSRSGSKQGGNGLSAFILLLVLLLAGAGGAGGYWLWQQMQTLTSAQDASKNKLQAQRNLLATIQTGLVSSDAANKEHSAAIIALQEALNSVNDQTLSLDKQIAVLKGTKETDWLVNELEYFVKLAQRRLELTQDPRGSTALLTYADEIARGIAERGIVAVRSAITNDLNLLNTAADVDVEGIYLRLETTSGLINNLALPPQAFEVAVDNAQVTDGTIDTEENNGFIKAIKRALGKIQTAIASSFEVHRLDEPVQALIAVDQRIFLEQNIVLALEQAQLALLRGENEVYKNSISQALGWIQDYYRTDTKTGQQVVTTLQELRLINVNPPTVTITASVDAVVSFKELWLESKTKRAALKNSISQLNGTSSERPTASTSSIVSASTMSGGEG